MAWEAQEQELCRQQVELGYAQYQLGQIDEATATHRQVLQRCPHHAEARLALSYDLLAQGDYQNGWDAFEARRQVEGMRPLEFGQPEWKGEELAGKRILLHRELGYGDVIQSIRFAPLVQQRGGRVIVLTYAPLRRLLANQAGIAHVVTTNEPVPDFDLHCPLLSLPRLFGTTLATIPADVPYLTPDVRLIERFATLVNAALSPSPRLSLSPSALKVGLRWAGGEGFRFDRPRSLALTDLAPLACVKGVRYFSLQTGLAGGQIKSPPHGLDLIDFTDDLADFADTAGLIANLDLIITTDTAVAHLAGAMGKRTWLVLHTGADWRWLRNRSDSPWYPTMRLFRQRQPGDWAGVLEEVAGELGKFPPPFSS